MPRALRIRRMLKRLGLGLVQINAHTINRRVFVRREAIVDALIADAHVETLRMLATGRLSIELLAAHAREHGMAGAGLAAQVATSAPLVEAIEAGVPEALVQVSLRHSNATMTRRYTKSAGKAAVADGLAKTMTEEG
jgi:hypothetical protein